MKSILLLCFGLFLVSGTVNAQSAQENPSASSAVMGYVKIPEITGESKSVQFKDQIEIFGLSSLIESSNGSQVGGGKTRGKAAISPITFIKKVDAASPYLMLANMKGRVYGEVTINLLRFENNAQTPYLTLKLQNVLVVKYELDAGSNRQETVSLAYEKITVTYAGGPKGKPSEITYDLVTGN